MMSIMKPIPLLHNFILSLPFGVNNKNSSSGIVRILTMFLKQLCENLHMHYFKELDNTLEILFFF